MCQMNVRQAAAFTVWFMRSPYRFLLVIMGLERVASPRSFPLPHKFVVRHSVGATYLLRQWQRVEPHLSVTHKRAQPLVPDL